MFNHDQYRVLLIANTGFCRLQIQGLCRLQIQGLCRLQTQGCCRLHTLTDTKVLLFFDICKFLTEKVKYFFVFLPNTAIREDLTHHKDTNNKLRYKSADTKKNKLCITHNLFPKTIYSFPRCVSPEGLEPSTH